QTAAVDATINPQNTIHLTVPHQQTGAVILLCATSVTTWSTTETSSPTRGSRASFLLPASRGKCPHQSRRNPNHSQRNKVSVWAGTLPAPVPPHYWRDGSFSMFLRLASPVNSFHISHPDQSEQ